jgi:hypothetical protein
MVLKLLERREQEALRQMPPTPRIMGQDSSTPSLGEEEVVETNKWKCSYHEILAGVTQTTFEDQKLETLI